MNGTVVRFEGTYGFIRTPEVPTDVFFHFTDLPNDGEGFRRINKGERVSFEAMRSDKGWRARNIERLPHERSGGRAVRK